VKFQSRSPEETKDIGFQLGSRLKPGDVVCLYGQLGAGKTIFVKGIARSLDIDETEVASASFIIIAEHDEGRIPLYHIDLYRIPKGETGELGLYEYFSGDGITVIEWAERLLDEEVPENAIFVTFHYSSEQTRKLEMKGGIKW
jgi:tRNA threonylcarbamoyladenosine biosynthesis protein TsaE